MLYIVCILLAAWALFTLGALFAAKAIGKRTWADTVKWMLEFFN